MSAQPAEANPVALGLAGASLPSILLGLINVGILPPAGHNVVVPLALVLGGTTQFIAGLLEAKSRNTFGLTAFVTFGAFWWWYALLLLLGQNGALAMKGIETTVAATLLLWGVFTFFLWLATFKLPRILFFIFLSLCCTFVLLGAAAPAHMPQLALYGGWAGVLSGGLMMYGSVAMVMRDSYGRTIFPF